MTSFLINKKMSPQLQERISRSIEGRLRPGQRAPTHHRLFRLLCGVSLVGIIGAGAVTVQADQEAVDQAKAGLRAHIAAAPRPQYDGRLEQIEAWIKKAGTTWQGTNRSRDHFSPAALSAITAQDSLYIRADVADTNSRKDVAQAAFESVKDSFLYCFMAPPEGASEKTLLRAVRTVYRGGDKLERATQKVARLHGYYANALIEGINWEARIELARTTERVDKLRYEFERVQADRIDEKARLLFYVVDEPRDKDTTSEFDGASAHWVRIGIVDLIESKELLRLRRPVDPSWISATARVRYARGLNSCKLGRQTRLYLEAGGKEPTPAAPPTVESN